ncbi:hypothetical protein BH23ACT10_BH23ACT10_40660 [soil metagenome]
MEGDADRLDQIALNLLTNAVKYTAAGGTVTVRTGVVDGTAQLTVTDTGSGLPDGEADRVFDRFWRGRVGQRTAGSGIGLAVAAELAAAHQGTLSAADTGAGARFTLALPGTGSDTRPTVDAAPASAS